MATFSCVWTIDGSTVQLVATFSGGDESFVGYRYVRYSLNGGSYTRISEHRSGGSVMLVGDEIELDPNTEYEWYAELGYKADGESSITWCAQYGYEDDGIFLTGGSGGGGSGGDDGPERPDDFSWTYPKVAGGDFNLTAREWNDYTERINEFRVYRGLDEYDFTRAYRGDDFTADMYNEARSAIRGISGYGSYIPKVEPGWTIYAETMDLLVSELNAIP